jgi:S1-C subfamily serine protease
MTTTWQQFSKDMSNAIEQAGKSLVAVDGRAGHTSSGIVWRRDSILTAAHAIRHETKIGVIFGPGQSVTGRLAGRDRGTDTALVKLDGEIEMQPAAFANPATLSVGEFTIAIARTRRGNLVASAGMISGLMGEYQVARTRIDQFIRPDLTLYAGFSGGALIDSAGSVLGLNTSGLLRGKSITIPSSTLTRIAESLSSSGHIKRPYIGLVMQAVQISDSLQKRAGVTSGAGLLVMHVEAGGPADSAGVLLGDVLLDIDGRTLAELDDVYEFLGQKTAGQDVQIDMIRAGQRLQLTIRIGERPAQ